MNPTTTTAEDFLATLLQLGGKAVITKNLDPNLEGNYRVRSGPIPDMLDGYWTGRPALIEPNKNFAIHFVAHRKRVWIGVYRGVEKSEKGQTYSLIVSDAQCYDVADLNFDDPRQGRLKSIFMRPGAVIYSYFDPFKVDKNIGRVEGAPELA